MTKPLFGQTLIYINEYILPYLLFAFTFQRALSKPILYFLIIYDITSEALRETPR